MTLKKFEVLIASCDSGKADKTWFPRWVRRYAIGFRNGLHAEFPINRTSVVEFSKRLLAAGAPAWQRLQAVRSLVAYRDLVLERDQPDLSDVIQLLSKFAKQERNCDIYSEPTAEEIRKLRGNLNESEPTHVQTMRGELRVLHYSAATERAYVRWLKRFANHVGSWNLEQFDDTDIEDFLTHLATEQNVSPSTQNQAQCGLIFFFQCVIGKKIGFINATRARRDERIAIWLSQGEIQRMLPHLVGVHRLMFTLMYGCGLRHKECRRLRIKDICFDEKYILVRDGKGSKDRITFLPAEIAEDLERQVHYAKQIHARDVEQGYPEVYMPHALAKKYPTACNDAAWKWVFPSRQRSFDKRSGKEWRHHIHEQQFAVAFKSALRAADIDKAAVPHSLRHSFATHLIESGVDIQTVQKLMGHKDVKTTMAYIHVNSEFGDQLKSPIDRLLART